MPRPTRLTSYLTLVNLLGLGLVLDLVARSNHRNDGPSGVLIVLMVLIVVGEAKPIRLSRGGEDYDEVTLSCTFALAAAMIGPLWALVGAQVLAAAVDDVRRRKELRRILFNASQLAITTIATRAAFCLVANRHYVADSRPLGLRDIVAGLVVGAVFFLVNNGLTGIVVAFALDRPLVQHVWEDVRAQLSTSGVLLSFAPVVAIGAQFSLLLVPLMLLPLAAVHRSADLAMQRERQALHDGLTDLPNRLFLQERLERALSEAERTGTSTGVLLLDLDHFKEINDTLGHYVGDELLKAVGQRLRGVLRDGDTVARLGGDEFAVLACDLEDVAGAVEIADRIVGAFAEPFSLVGVRVDVQASMGIAVGPLHGSDPATLMQRADVALYSAKENRGCFAVYSAEHDSHSVEKLALLGELRQGIAAGQLVVHYQPKCDAKTGAAVGLEALVRWQHPVRGLMYPDSFIALAENTGVIGALTLTVLDQALAETATLHRLGHRVGIAVNMSVRVLTDLELPLRIASLLERYDVDPAALTLEVTETSIMVDPVRTMVVLGQLRDLGVSLSIDDFGTGYSSLAYLRRLDAHELKIDKSFVFAMAHNSNDAVIVRSTIELGHNLGLRLVAEGVEDATTWTMLRQLGCDVIQGYHLARPMPADEIELWMDAYRPASPVGAR